MPEGIPLLDRLDLALMGMGIVVLSVSAANWLRRGRPDPLTGSPDRVNQVGLVTVWFCVVVYLLGIAVGGQMVRLLPASLTSAQREVCASILAANVCQVVVILTCLGAASVAFADGLSGFGLSFRHPGRDLKWSLAGWLSALTLTGLVLWYTSWFLITFRPSFDMPLHPVFVVLNQAGTPEIVRFLAYFGAAVLAPLSEEMLLRGIIQTGLARLAGWGNPSSRDRWIAIAGTATLFGMMHMQTPHFIPALILLGVLLGYVYERTGSLWAPIGLHMLFNMKSLLWFVLQTRLGE